MNTTTYAARCVACGADIQDVVWVYVDDVGSYHTGCVQMSCRHPPSRLEQIWKCADCGDVVGVMDVMGNPATAITCPTK